MRAYATEVAKEETTGVDEIVHRLGGWAPGFRAVNLHNTKAQTMPSGFALMVPPERRRASLRETRSTKPSTGGP